MLVLGRDMPEGDWIVDTTEAPMPATAAVAPDVTQTPALPTAKAQPDFRTDGQRHIIPFPDSAASSEASENSHPKSA